MAASVLANAPAVLLSEKPVAPPECPEGVPLEEMVSNSLPTAPVYSPNANLLLSHSHATSRLQRIPTCEQDPAVVASFVPSVTTRATVDPAPLANLLQGKGARAWDPNIQSQTNVPFVRPAHDRWGVGKFSFLRLMVYMM